MFTARETNNLKATFSIGITSNEGQGFVSILPERFGSISSPSGVPIVLPELGSVSEPKVGRGSANTSE